MKYRFQYIFKKLYFYIQRFGHSSVVFEEALYIYGGFNGQLLNDLLRYQPGNCNTFTKQEKCTNARPGVKCIWDVQKMRCIPITRVQRSAIYSREQYDYFACPPKSRFTMTSEILNDVIRCHKQNNCQSCVANTFDCTYCGNGICTKQRCRETSSVNVIFYDTTTMNQLQSQYQHQLQYNIDSKNTSLLEKDNINMSTMSNAGGSNGISTTSTSTNTGGSTYSYNGSSISQLNVKLLENCPATEEFYTQSVCERLHSCQACLANIACVWEFEPNRCRPYLLASHNGLVGNRLMDEIICPPACSSFTSCHNCTEDDCIWCQNEQRCVDRNAYTASFSYGQCREWTTLAPKCRITPVTHNKNVTIAYSAQCGFYNSCVQCLDDPACGWCDDGSHTGLGACMEGGALKAHESVECPQSQWHFTSCPRCNCNGHSHCIDETHCEQPCFNLTIGSHCEKCSPGYWGNPINGGQCHKCECNNQGDLCNSDTGKCYCNTKGIVGDRCEKCDSQNNYHGDPITTSCYYELTIDYQFTFNLSKKEDRHFRQINFRSSPTKSEIDADFTITCSVPAKMDIAVKKPGAKFELIFKSLNCSTFRHRFAKTEYQFGLSTEDNSSLTTFYVMVHDFQPPIWVQIAFSQYPKLNLQQFFITFSTCFLLLLLMAAVLWKIKQKYDMFRRRQRLFVEMEQMASRPFAQVTFFY